MISLPFRIRLSTFSIATIAAGVFSSPAADGLVLWSSGTPISDAVDRATLVSRQNDNSVFQLTLHCAKPYSHDYGKLGLLIGRATVRFSAGGYNSPTDHTIDGYVRDRELAEKVAAHFKIKPTYRTHPGYRLTARFIPTKTAFSPDEPVTASLRIGNVDTKPFVFMRGGRQRGPRDNQFAFSCEHDLSMAPDIGDPTSMGGPAWHVTIPPGQFHEIPVDLRKWFAFDKPGAYGLRGSYYLEIANSAGEGKTVWEDFVADEFLVTIK
jgi:hypothetical protein